MSTGVDEPERTRGHKKRERTRQRLVAAAVDVIAERGEAFAVSDVTERAGVANGTFYNYFPDRDALIADIVPEVLAGFAAEQAAAVVDDDPAERFAAITAQALRRAATAPAQLQVVLRLTTAQQLVLDGEPFRHLRQDLADGRAAGRFSVEPDDAVLDVVVGAILAACRRIVAGGADDGYAADVIGVLLGGLGVDRPEAVDIARRAVAGTSPTADG